MNYCSECGVHLIVCQHMRGCSFYPRVPVGWIAQRNGEVLHFAVRDGWKIEEVLTEDKPC